MISNRFAIESERKYMETVRFDELDLYPQILRAIREMGFEEATPIQSKAIPVVMEGVDVIGQAQTGTGKTAAFGIPLYSVPPGSLPSRWQKKSAALQNICMG